MTNNTPSQTRERRHPVLAVLDWFTNTFRPRLGWGIFLGALALVWMPVLAVREARWVHVGRAGVTPEWVVLIGLAVTWGLVGWWQALRAQMPRARWRRVLVAVPMVCLWLLIGLAVVSQVIGHWLPSPLRLIGAARSGDWATLGAEIVRAWAALWWRFEQWFVGVQGAGALQDDLVFLSWILLFLWIVASLTAWLALRTRSGLLLALPSLWALVLALYYGGDQRWLLVSALGVAVLLHLWLDQMTLEAGWQRQAIDYSPALFYDRLFIVAGITFLILMVALVVPSPSVNATVRWAYNRLQPVYEPLETAGERLFPDLERQARGRYGGVGSGLPNRFLLGAGPYLSESPVMWVGTNRSSTPYDAYGYEGYFEEPAVRFYMRRATFANYNGSGWQNPVGLVRESYAAQRSWFDGEWVGRVPLRQWVRMAEPTTLLYAAGEPVEPGIDYQTTARSGIDLVALWADGGAVTRYEIISSVPSADDEALRTWPDFEDQNVPADLEPHLRLPDTISERTRDLASDLVAGQEGQYGKATAIEQYLRGYAYDLDVPQPPADQDVADYFLFELQRGYCDYYATAFVVLARLAGLPARFATGYVPGAWNPESQEWVITEAEAHSWPEVYFPELGWVPFEPTAGRSTIQRINFDTGARSAVEPADLPPAPASEAAEAPRWNWQMLVWLLPVILILVLLWQWFDRRQPRDPWLALIAWGRRVGRPLAQSETELEYGRELAHHLVEAGGEPERVRRLSGSVLALSRAISEAHYGPETVRPPALQRAAERWQAIRREIRRFW